MAICGLDCCKACGLRAQCAGCEVTGGRPFGGSCVAAQAIATGGSLAREKERLIDEFNALGLTGVHVDDLNLIQGFYVNLEYPLENGSTVKLLRDDCVYWANQIAGEACCYGLVADERYLLVSQYGPDGTDPQILAYKKRGANIAP